MTQTTPVEKEVVVRDALEHSKNVLLDYIHTLEAQGASLNYGHSVIRRIDHALSLMERP